MKFMRADNVRLVHNRYLVLGIRGVGVVGVVSYSQYPVPAWYLV